MRLSTCFVPLGMGTELLLDVKEAEERVASISFGSSLDTIAKGIIGNFVAGRCAVLTWYSSSASSSSSNSVSSSSS